MKFKYLIRNNAPGLILFFTGWGSDEHPVRHLQCDSADVAVIYDYTHEILTDSLGQPLTGDFRPENLMQQYRTLHLIAWSMGVRSAEWFFRPSFCEETPGPQALGILQSRLGRAVAINGTAAPIHPSWGIPPAIYDGTAENLPAGLDKFNFRMCGEKDTYRQYLLCAPQRDPAELKPELLALRERLAGLPQQPDFHLPWQTAIIAGGDRIFPAANQYEYWTRHRPAVRIAAIPGGHYPFLRWTRWEEILETPSVQHLSTDESAHPA